jgi:hypothetical protein
MVLVGLFARASVSRETRDYRSWEALQRQGKLCVRHSPPPPRSALTLLYRTDERSPIKLCNAEYFNESFEDVAK